MSYDLLKKKVLWAKYYYYVKYSPVMSDYEFDMLEKKLKKKDRLVVSSDRRQDYPLDIESWRFE